MNKTRLKTLAACIAVLGTPAAFADNTAADAVESSALETVIVKGNRNKHQTGRDRVYTREVVNLYKGKEEVETFKGNTVSDLFSGMVGVYSGDARNSGAVDPNIRGVQGQGRIPVTVDRTEATRVRTTATMSIPTSSAASMSKKAPRLTEASKAASAARWR